jgi:phosphinothricin acetyltransferase
VSALTPNFRLGVIADLPALTEIYNHYVLHTHSTFNSEPLSVDDRREWFDRFRADGPRRLLVAENDGVVLGCAYSDVYRDHPAFRETIETSIYLSPIARGKGLGTALYRELFASLRDEKLHLAVAGIALPNEASVALHKKVGFTEVGVFKEYARVRDRYYSSIWLQKPL